MKDFRLYDISDFVMDEDFIRWIQEQREEDNHFWNTWLQQHPDKLLVIASARRIVEAIQFKQSAIHEQEMEQEVTRLLQTIGSRQAPPEQPQPVKGKVIAYTWWYAAAILLVCITGVWLYYNQAVHARPFAYSSMVAAKQLIEHTNTAQQPLAITLPDGSEVLLAAQSRIGYARTFGIRDTAKQVTRDVYLLGEAFFKVTKDPHRPFRVFANEIVTKVLGTSFTVRSFEKDTTIQVTVRTGKVTVYTQPVVQAAAPSGEIIVTPNQQLVYERAARHFQKVLLSNPAMIAPAAKQQSMVYDEAPLAKVFSDLSNAYEINIVFDNEVLRKCTVTADLTREPFYQQLNLICSAIDARYELIDGQVVIIASGCK